jgi:hypothetical protein
MSPLFHRILLAQMTLFLFCPLSSLEDTVRVFHCDDFDSSHTIKHNNQTGRWLSTFKYDSSFHLVANFMTLDEYFFKQFHRTILTVAGQSGVGTMSTSLLGT